MVPCELQVSEQEQAMPQNIDDIVKISPDVHRVLFENAAIRVLEVTVQPGAKVPMHTNPENVNYINKTNTHHKNNPNNTTNKHKHTKHQVIPAPVGRHSVENI